MLKFKGTNIPAVYRALVFSKFLRSLRYGNAYFNLIEQSAYFSIYHAVIELLLTRPELEARFAVLGDDSDVVLGWALVEGRKLHYVYVNRENRRIGIGKTLVGGGIQTVTHLTELGLSIWHKLGKTVFNPFA